MDATIAINSAHIRPVDPRRDLLVIADLIEICFIDQMDEEGREYVRQIRHAAQSGDFFRWTHGADELVSLPLGGFVWVEEQHVVGNLTIIPFWASGWGKGAAHWRYLIANVAVHPNYRRRGIGRQLTMKALDHIHQRHADAWLQVRDDNPAAHNLYLSLGFEERARRTTWEISNSAPLPEMPSHLVIGKRQNEDWPLQSTWLRQTFPPEVAWNLGFHLKRLEPGLWRSLVNLFMEAPVTHWVVRRGQQIIGAACWDPGAYRAENLWLAADPNQEEEALFALLVQARRSLMTRRPLTVNYPVDQGTIAFNQAGFFKQNTLIWMEHKQKP
jgi:ribosomal protein S18 acetylase RimI-like enzyme